MKTTIRSSQNELKLNQMKIKRYHTAMYRELKNKGLPIQGFRLYLFYQQDFQKVYFI